MHTKSIQTTAFKAVAITAASLSFLAPISRAHEVAVTLQNPDAVTQVILPTVGAITFESAQQFQRSTGDDSMACQQKFEKDSHKSAGWECAPSLPWNERAYCRDWTGVSMIQGEIPVTPNTVKTTFGNNGKLTADLDLRGSEFTVSLILIGERVGTLDCSLWHPFEQTIVYAVDVRLQGASAKASATLGVTSNGNLMVDSLDSVEFEAVKDSVTIDTLTNNQIDLALVGSLASLYPLPGVVPLAAAGAYALIEGIDVGNLALLQDLAASIHGVVWRGCDNTEDCLKAIAERAIEQNEDLILEQINDALDQPLPLAPALQSDLTTLGIQSSVDIDLGVTLSGISTSAAENTLTAFWETTISGTSTGTCASGISGFTAPTPEPGPSVNGDLSVSVPFTLIGDAVSLALGQLNLCGTPFNYGSFTANFAGNGNLAVNRGGARKITLSQPLRLDATGPGRGSFTFDAVLETKPQLGHAGETTLVLQNTFITNLAGQIDVRLNAKTKLTYILGNNACVAINNGPCIPAPDLAPAIQQAVNNAIGTLFPIPLTYRSTLYVAPHIFLQEQDVAVGNAAFSLGLNIKDGSRSIDLAIPRLEATAPYTDTPSILGITRKVPLNVIIKNRDTWYESAPVDVTLQVGNQIETRWVPPLQPGEEYALPLTVYTLLNSRGTVVTAPTIIAVLDPNAGTGDRVSNEATVVDPNRDNNRLEQRIDNTWFRPDATVAITDLQGLMQNVEHGTTIRSSEIVGASFTVTCLVRNIGGGHEAPNSLRRLTVSVNGVDYASQYVAGLQSGTSTEAVFEINVPEGPNHYPCAYDVQVQLAAADVKPANDDHTVSVVVESSSCLDGGATDADLATVEGLSEDFLDARFSGLETVEWHTDNRGHANGGLDLGTSNAPILDQIDP